MPEANDAGTEQERRFWSRVRAWSLHPYFALGLALLVAVVALGAEAHSRAESIESWIRDLGPWGPAVYVGVFIVLACVFVPDSLLSIIAGALFGLAWGAAVVIVAGTLACLLQYALARSVLRGRVRRFVSSRPQLAAIERAVRRQELRLQVLIRLTPLSPALVSYLLGATGVRFGGFATALVALVPAYLLQVYFGHAGNHVAQMAGGGIRLGDGLLLVGLGAFVVVMIVVARTARKAIEEAESLGAAAPGGPGGPTPASSRTDPRAQAGRASSDR